MKKKRKTKKKPIKIRRRTSRVCCYSNEWSVGMGPDCWSGHSEPPM